VWLIFVYYLIVNITIIIIIIVVVIVVVIVSGPFAQLTKICYLCRAATAVSDKKFFLLCP